MEVTHERCCGLDVHKKVVVACRLLAGEKEPRSFGTTTGELRSLAAWLKEGGCTQVAMESTGSYWKPVYNILEEEGFTLVVVNTRHLKLVPGRKSDVKDAEWIADLLQHGLLKASFIPSREAREMRELTRYRTALVGERTGEVNRIQKVLEGANSKLSSVVTNVVGVSGRAMLEAIVAGMDDSNALAALAKGKLRAKQASLEEALLGLVRPHQRFLLRQQLRHLDELDQLVAEVDEEIALRQAPFLAARERLETIPGVGRKTAEVLLSEVGPEVSRFPTAGHLASWAGACPGLNESAGKNRSGRTPKGSPWLRTALVQAAHAAGRTRTYLGAQYRRLRARVGAKKAAMAVAHSILVIAYHLLRDQDVYRDLGVNYFEKLDPERAAQKLAHRIEQLGFTVSFQPAA